MAPVVPFIPLITAALGAAATVTSTVVSSNQAKKSEERALEYQKQLAAEEQAAREKEDLLNAQSIERSRAYSASLLQGDSLLNNSLTGFDDESNTSILSSRGNSLGSSLFI